MFLNNWLRTLGISVVALIVVLAAGAHMLTVHARIVASFEVRLADAGYNLELFLNGRLQALRIMAEQPEIVSLDAAIIRPRLVRLTDNWGLRNAALFDEEGIFITSVELARPKFVNDYTTFLRALSGSPVISNRIIRTGSYVPFVSLRVPVRDEFGRPRGVLSAGISGIDIADQLGAINRDPRFSLMVLDGNHEVIYHSDLSVLLGGEQQALVDFGAGLIGDNLDSAYARCPVEQVAKLFIAAPVRGTDWLLVAAVPATSVILAVAGEAFFGVAALISTVLLFGQVALSWNQARKHRNELDAQRMQQLASINQLAAGIAHEIRNPLTSIKGFIQFYLSRSEQRLNPEHMGIILEEIGRIEQLINEFRLLARPQEHTDMVRTDVTVTVGNTVTLLNSTAIAKCAELRYKPGKAALITLGNAGMLKQLWINLIRNAIEAVPCGGKVEVRTARKQNCCVVSIKDNGAGIAADMLGKLGTPFFTTKEGGTGLGLSVSYNIVHKHKGTIEYSSTVGKGTTVVVTLPLA